MLNYSRKSYLAIDAFMISDNKSSNFRHTFWRHLKITQQNAKDAFKVVKKQGDPDAKC